MGEPKEKRFTIRMTDDLHRMMMAVAEHERRSAGDWIRIQIENRYEELRREKKIKK